VKAAALLIAVTLGAYAVAEVAMEPTGSARRQFALIFGATVALAGLVAWGLPRLSRRATALRRSIGLLVGAVVLVVAAGVALAGRLMFFSSHDLELLWLVVGFALVLGLVLAATVPASMTADLEDIATTARRVGQGGRGVRTGVGRTDEIGQLAATFDEMLDRLEASEARRERDDEARRKLLAAIGHDLRTPLAALQAAIEALQDGVAPDPARYLRSMEADVAALATLVDDLFVLAALEAGDVELELMEVDLAELADEAVEVLEPAADRTGVTVRVRAGGRVRVRANPESLGRVVRNLIDNALRHAPPGTEVVVEVGDGEVATLVVRDEGPGFPPGFLDEAFSPFTRADRSRSRQTGGAGLGLAIAKGFVEAHGGRIWAEEGPGGTVGFGIPAEPRTATGG
jgi:two-component system sensor histidine kinase BaeS